MLKRSRHRAAARAARVLVESLESRTLLSGTVAAVVSPRITGAIHTPHLVYEKPSVLLAHVSSFTLDPGGTVQAWIQWDDRRVVKASVVHTIDGYDIYAASPPSNAGPHGFAVAFWETSPVVGHELFHGHVIIVPHAPKVTNVLTLGGGLVVDTNSPNTFLVHGSAESAITAPIATITGVFTANEILPPSVDGQTSPITFAPDADHTATVTILINWGDGQTSAGTLHSDGAGGWDVYGTHLYERTGRYRIHVEAGIAVESNTFSLPQAGTTILDAYTTATVTRNTNLDSPPNIVVPVLVPTTVTLPGDSRINGAVVSSSAADLPTATAGAQTNLTLGTATYGFSSADVSSVASPNAIDLFYGDNPVGSQITVDVRFGDGTEGLATFTPADSGAWTLSTTHTYAHAGDYTISVSGAVQSVVKPGTTGNVTIGAGILFDPYFQTSIHVTD